MTFEEAREATKAGWIVAKYMALDEAMFRFKKFILFDAPLGFCVAYICDDNLSASSSTRCPYENVCGTAMVRLAEMGSKDYPQPALDLCDWVLAEIDKIEDPDGK